MTIFDIIDNIPNLAYISSFFLFDGVNARTLVRGQPGTRGLLYQSYSILAQYYNSLHSYLIMKHSRHL